MRMFLLSSHYVKEGHGLGRGVHFVIEKRIQCVFLYLDVIVQRLPGISFFTMVGLLE